MAFYPANISASFRLLFAKPALCLDIASQTQFSGPPALSGNLCTNPTWPHTVFFGWNARRVRQ